MAQTDADLVREALDGAQAAFHELVDRHQRAVFNLALRLLRDEGAAEDVTQETFLKAFQRLSSFDTTRRLAPWLLRIAHNTAIDTWRRAGPPVGPLGADVADRLDHTRGPTAGVDQADLRRALGRALEQLRQEYRAAVMLRYHEGLSYADIAHVMGIPEGTAKTYVHRARRQLANLLTEGGWRT